MKMAGDFIRRAQHDGLVDPVVDPEAWLVETGIGRSALHHGTLEPAD